MRNIIKPLCVITYCSNINQGVVIIVVMLNTFLLLKFPSGLKKFILDFKELK